MYMPGSLKNRAFVVLVLFFISTAWIDCKYVDEEPQARTSVPNVKWYNQRLNHFNNADQTTWKQRYWVNDTFFNGTGPVFLWIGGEGELNPLWIVFGQILNYAKEFNGLVVSLEHRFYGKSRPTSDLSVDNLVYLSSEQALADLASFRQHIVSKYNLKEELNKWVAYGGSYPGSLAAWFRLKYPHLVHAAIASSAPMLALVDFYDYLVVVDSALATYSPNCPAIISQAMTKIQDLMKNTTSRSVLESLFKTCDPIVSDDDVTSFYSVIVGNIQGVVQYNLANRKFLELRKTIFKNAVDINVTIDVVCNIMTNASIGDPLTRYAQVNTLLAETYNRTCLKTAYRTLLDAVKNTSWNTQEAENGDRQWFWQTCTEFGFYQSTGSDRQPFGATIPVEFYTKQCEEIFGAKFSLESIKNAVNNTNRNYGGYNYKGSRVLFLNGDIDPWHALSYINSAPNPDTHFTFIRNASHCADRYPNSDMDSADLQAAREYTKTLLKIWLDKDDSL